MSLLPSEAGQDIHPAHQPLGGYRESNVVPSLHKLYSLATIYHLSSLEISGWYEAPFNKRLKTGAAFPAPRTQPA